MSNTKKFTGKSFSIGAITIKQVEIEPCHRLIAIGKGLAQYCKCASCVNRGDSGVIVRPV